MGLGHRNGVPFTVGNARDVGWPVAAVHRLLYAKKPATEAISAVGAMGYVSVARVSRQRAVQKSIGSRGLTVLLGC